MATKKDYYEILGVSRNADEKQLKAAYRKLARRYHPDVNKGDKAAEARFKEVAEAFAVLSDPQKRARYDRGGHEAFGAGFDPFAGFDFSQGGLGDFADLFSLFGLGGRGRSTRRGPQRGEDLRRTLRISFMDAVRGATLTLTIPRRVPCPACAGAGTGESAICPDCQGTGRRRQRASGLQACRRCGGSGRSGQPCAACSGSGAVGREDRVKVRIPAGVETGSVLRLAGQGDAGETGAPPGDLFLALDVEPHPRFRREGRDLYCDLPLTLGRAALGGTVEVETLEGQATITVPQGTRSGQKLRLKGRGLAGSATEPPGDLYAVIQVHPPRTLDGRSRELLEEFERRNPVPG